MSDRQQAATRLIAAFDDHFQFEDHRRLEQGDAQSVAERLKRKAQYQRWVGGLLTVCFTGWAALNLIDYGAGGEQPDLILAIVMLAVAVGNAAFTAHQSARITSAADQALRLLDEDREREPA